MTKPNTPPARSIEELEDRAIEAMDGLVKIVEDGIQCHGTNGRPLTLPDGTPQRRPAPASYHSALRQWLQNRARVVEAIRSVRPRTDGLSPTAAAMREMVARGRDSSLLAGGNDDFSELRA